MADGNRRREGFRFPRLAASFVGRAGERACLARLLATNPAVLVRGTVGIGKTELVLRVTDDESCAGKLPPPAYASIAAAKASRDLMETSAHALGRRCPTADDGRIDDVLVALLQRTPCVMVWDDAPTVVAGALVPFLRVFWRADGPSRLVVISRTLLPLGSLGLEMPSFEVPPLAPEDRRALLASAGAGRTRAELAAIEDRAGGNPLLIRLALAGTEGVVGCLDDDPIAALRRILDELAAGPTRRTLSLLVAAEVPLDEGDLVSLVGRSASRALDELARHHLLCHVDGRVALAAGLAGLAAATVGEPEAEILTTLQALADRARAARPGDPDALLLSCRVRAMRSDAATALAQLEEHVAARVGIASRDVARVVRAIAAADPRCAARAWLLCAREELRRGDVEAALRSLDELPASAGDPAVAIEAPLLRAQALARTGAVAVARRELEGARGAAREPLEPAVEIELAGLAILRGELEIARRTLFALTPSVRSHADLDGRRTAALALSYLFEERFDLAVACARRARKAYRLLGTAPLEPLLSLIDVLARLRLDEIDQGAALVAREGEARGEADGRAAAGTVMAMHGADTLCRAALLGRRGELAQCLEVAAEGLEALDQRADRLIRAVVARHMARAAIGLGLFERAEELLRIVAGVAAEPGLGALSSTCDLDLAILADARGDLPEARSRAEMALARAAKNPFARIEAWALGDSGETCLGPAGPAGVPTAVATYAALRGAERSLARGDPRTAIDLACRAERWYRQVGASHEHARALLAWAEGLARVGDMDQALHWLAGCDALAERHGYRALLVSAALVRASVADRAGDIEGYVAALGRALRHAGPSLCDGARARACERVGLSARPTGRPDMQPFAGPVARLALARPATVLMTVGEKAFLTDGDQSPVADAHVQLDLLRRELRAGAGRVSLARQPLLCHLLGALVDAGVTGLGLDELYRRVWGGSEFHPLRHRNTVYGAVGRLRRALGRLGLGDTALVQAEGRYRLAPGLVVAVSGPVVAGDARAGWIEPQARFSAGASAAPGLSLAVSRWESALRSAGQVATAGR